MIVFLEKLEQNSLESKKLEENPDGKTGIFLSNKGSGAGDSKFEIIINDNNKTNGGVDHKQSFILTEGQFKKLSKKEGFSSSVGSNRFNFTSNGKNYTTYFIDRVDVNNGSTVYVPYVRLATLFVSLGYYPSHGLLLNRLGNLVHNFFL